MACANAKRARKRQQQDEEIQCNGLTSLIILILLRIEVTEFPTTNKNTTANNIQMASDEILRKFNAYAVIELFTEPQSW